MLSLCTLRNVWVHNKREGFERPRKAHASIRFACMVEGCAFLGWTVLLYGSRGPPLLSWDVSTGFRMGEFRSYSSLHALFLVIIYALPCKIPVEEMQRARGKGAKGRGRHMLP